jgi:iron complex outermembrane receptor protein
LEAYSQTDFNLNYEIETNTVLKRIVISALINNIFDSKYVSNGYFFTYDDDFSNPGTITTIEGAGYYPQAGINFLLGINFQF